MNSCGALAHAMPLPVPSSHNTLVAVFVGFYGCRLGCAYAAMGFTFVVEPAVSPHFALHAHLELAAERRDVQRKAEGAGLDRYVIQLVGHEAHWMAEGARLAEGLGVTTGLGVGPGVGEADGGASDEVVDAVGVTVTTGPAGVVVFLLMAVVLVVPSLQQHHSQVQRKLASNRAAWAAHFKPLLVSP